MSKVKIDEIALKEKVGAKIFNRGRQYFKQGRVLIIAKSENKTIAMVNGARKYTVTLDFKPNKLVETTCTCPYDWGDICKHKVATILQYNVEFDKELSVKEEKGENRRKTWESMLEDVENEKLTSYKSNSTTGKIIFKIFTMASNWRIEATRIYIKKDGSFGRELSINSYEISRNNYNHSISELMVIRFLMLENYYHSDFVERSYNYGADTGEIFNLLKNSKIYLEGNLNSPLTIDTGNNTLSYQLKQEENHYSLSLTLTDGNSVKYNVNENFRLLAVKPVCLLKMDGANIIYRVQAEMNSQLILPFMNQNEFLPIMNEEIPELLEKVYPKIKSTNTEFIIPDKLKLIEVEDFRGKALYLSEEEGDLRIKPVSVYGKENLRVDMEPFMQTQVVKNDDQAYIIKRNKDIENRLKNLLTDNRLIYNKNGHFRLANRMNPIDWLFEILPVFTESGFDIFGEEKLDKLKVNRSSAKIVSSLSTKQDWFDLQVEIDFEGMRVSYFEIMKALKKKKKYIRLNNGTHVKINNEIMEKLGFISSFSDKNRDDETLQFHKTQALLLNEIILGSTQDSIDPGFKKHLKKLKSFDKIKPVPLAAGFKGKLRPYQQAGLNWLNFLNEFGFGGCLADDMGLGKTIQALAMLQNEKNENNGSNLIVAPTSVISNWEREAQKFTPNLSVYLHYGADREKDINYFNKNDLIITSYTLLWRDYELFKEYSFNYIILDESQKIKNPNSLSAKAVKTLKAKHRLVMTGTPIENNLNELWSQFQFINPGMLGRNKSFQSHYAKKIEKEGDAKKAAELRRVIFPFVLRRTKEEVLKELPSKVENTIFCNMNDYHEKEYNTWRDYYRSEILAHIEKKGMAKSKIKILEGLTKLRQVSIHPKMVNPKYNKESGKTEALWGLIDEVMSEGHKVLVFSQFVKALTLVCEHLDNMGISYCYLDGRTKKRQEVVDRFQTDENIKIFLISLKAGGLGLNLTAADYVIHIDPWWNPAVESQANDRAHRMGQKKKVFVYKLITTGTVEEKILRLQEKKKELANELISSDAAFFKNISKNDIEHLFS